MTEAVTESTRCPFGAFMESVPEIIGRDFNNLSLNGKFRDFPKNIVVLGCGGTGSWFAPKLVKMINDATRKGLISVGTTKIEIMFIDGDDIEEKNLIRQNFIPADVGKNKAEVLATRYGGQFDPDFVRCTYSDKFVNNKKYRAVDPEVANRFMDFSQLGSFLGPRRNVLYINLIDNAITRKIVHLTAMGNSKSTVIDVANNEYNGQLTVSMYGQSSSQIDSDASWFYNTVEEQLESNDDVSVFSCADADAEAVDQLFNANDMAATVLGTYINNWITDRKVSFGRVDFVTGTNMSVRTSIPFYHAFIGSIGGLEPPSDFSNNSADNLLTEIAAHAEISIADINRHHVSHFTKVKAAYHKKIKDSLWLSKE